MNPEMPLPKDGADTEAAPGWRPTVNQEIPSAAGAATRMSQLAPARAELERLAPQDPIPDQMRLAIEKERADLKAATSRIQAAQHAHDQEVARFQAMSGAAFRAMQLLDRAARRYPWLARQTWRVARVVWWTLRGRLVERLRARSKARRRREAALPRFPSHLLKPLPSAQLPLSGIASSANQGDEGQGANAVSWEELGQALVARPGDATDDVPLVSVIVISFNYGAHLEAAVDSVLGQTFKNLEVIVVEGGSSDPASRLVAANLRRPRTRVLMQEVAHKVGANRNLGIAHAKGRYVCCLDADDTLAPTYIEKAVFLLERHGYDVISSALELVGEESGLVTILEKPDLGALLDGNHVLTSAVFRRVFWDRAGGYSDVTDAADGHVHEDWAFWIRLAALGARFRNLPLDPMLRYRVHGQSLSRRPNVVPMDQQRRLVRQVNEDVLAPLTRILARSGALAAREYGTPIAPPAEILLEPNGLEGAQNDVAGTILLALPYLVLGGAERLLLSVVEDLAARGWRVVIVTSLTPSPDQGDTTAWFERFTSEIFHLPRGLPAEMREDFLHHLIASRGVQILWIAGNAFAYDALRGLRSAHPTLRVVDLLFNTVGHVANNRRRRDLIDVTIVENNEVLTWLSARAAAEERLRLISSGVDLAVLKPMPRSTALIEQIGASDDDLIIGFVGRWSEEKNPLGFIEIARLVDAAMDVKFVMIGAGPLRPAVEAAIQKAGFANGRFHLLGEVPDPVPIMGSLDILVVPSVLDGRPMAILEALALGVPVLASGVGGIPELIQHGRTGWLQEPQDLPAFAATIEGARQDRARLQEMRGCARRFAEEKLDVRDMLESYRRELTRLTSFGDSHV